MPIVNKWYIYSYSLFVSETVTKYKKEKYFLENLGMYFLAENHTNLLDKHHAQSTISPSQAPSHRINVTPLVITLNSPQKNFQPVQVRWACNVLIKTHTRSLNQFLPLRAAWAWQSLKFSSEHIIISWSVMISSQNNSFLIMWIGG